MAADSGESAVAQAILWNVPRKRSKETHERYCLGMGAWTESSSDDNKENIGPAEKRTKSLKLRRKDPDRWDFVSEDRESDLSRKYVPKNTAATTKWAITNFNSWKLGRNKRFAGDSSKCVPDDILETTDSAVLCRWLTLYVAETRKQDGSKYPPKTMYSLLTGLLRHCRALDPNSPNFLDVHDSKFQTLHNAVDNVFRELRQSGVGSENKSAEIFTKEDENELWDAGILGMDSPKTLSWAVFFLNGKNLRLRGGEEHRNLKLSQVKRHTNPDRYVYTENTSKNRSGGLAQMRVSKKVVPVYPVSGNRCHVKILDMYLSKLPADAAAKDNFYLQPLPNVLKKPNDPWFSIAPIGRNSLVKTVKEMCAVANISGHKTNHSLHATGASYMFQAGVPEKLIQQRTGHHSLTGLRQYERTTTEQQQAVCQILSADIGETCKDPCIETQKTSTSRSYPTLG